MSSIDLNVALPVVLKLAELAISLRANRPGGQAATPEELAAIRAVRTKLKQWPSRRLEEGDDDGNVGNGHIEDVEAGEAQED